MSDNAVYKCERCGKLYTNAELCKRGEELRYYLVKRQRSLSDGGVGLCDDCAIALNDFMDREKKNAPKAEEKKAERPVDYTDVIVNALAAHLAKEIIQKAEASEEDYTDD